MTSKYPRVSRPLTPLRAIPLHLGAPTGQLANQAIGGRGIGSRRGMSGYASSRLGAPGPVVDLAAVDVDREEHRARAKGVDASLADIRATMERLAVLTPTRQPGATAYPMPGNSGTYGPVGEYQARAGDTVILPLQVPSNGRVVRVSARVTVGDGVKSGAASLMLRRVADGVPETLATATTTSHEPTTVTVAVPLLTGAQKALTGKDVSPGVQFVVQLTWSNASGVCYGWESYSLDWPDDRDVRNRGHARNRAIDLASLG